MLGLLTARGKCCETRLRHTLNSETGKQLSQMYIPSLTTLNQWNQSFLLQTLTHYPLRDLFNVVLVISIFRSSNNNASYECHKTLLMISHKSTLVQVMTWFQGTSDYLGQCWPRSFWPYGITEPNWINTYPPSDTCRCWGTSFVYIMACPIWRALWAHLVADNISSAVPSRYNKILQYTCTRQLLVRQWGQGVESLI